MRLSLIIPILLFLTCAYNLPEQPQEDNIPDIIFQDNALYRWFRDSALNDFIIPKEWEDDTGMVVIHVGNPDYTETVLPDTFWGTYHSYFWPSETLACVQCSCWNASGGEKRDFGWYFDSLGIEFNSW